MLKKIICVGIIGVIVLIVYSCCVVAGDEDERMGIK